MNKQCKKCSKILNIEKFSNHPECKDGKNSCCRDCEAKRNKEWREKQVPKSPVKTGTKKCANCKQFFDVSNFGNKKDTKDGKQRICKKCQLSKNKKWKKTTKGKAAHARYQKKRNRAIKIWLLSQIGDKCECGESHPACLDFHHIDPSEKKFAVSVGPKWKKEVLLEEAKKCKVICANCHRKLHWQD